MAEGDIVTVLKVYVTEPADSAAVPELTRERVERSLRLHHGGEIDALVEERYVEQEGVAQRIASGRDPIPQLPFKRAQQGTYVSENGRWRIVRDPSRGPWLLYDGEKLAEYPHCYQPSLRQAKSWASFIEEDERRKR